MCFFPYWFASYRDQVSVLTCLFPEHARVCFLLQMCLKFLFIFSVILAKVLSQEEKNDTGIFDLEILQTFKGTSRLNQTAGILFYGFERGLFAKSYTEKCSSMCGVWLADGTVYLHCLSAIWLRSGPKSPPASVLESAAFTVKTASAEFHRATGMPAQSWRVVMVTGRNGVIPTALKMPTKLHALGAKLLSVTSARARRQMWILYCFTHSIVCTC